MSAVRVSVVTPSFNQAGFIARTLASVLDQDYPDIEHIVVDGGSTDQTVALLSEVRPPQGKLFMWRSQRDFGQADAVNKGIAAASGSIIGWLNSDDVYWPGAVAKAVRHFEQNPSHMAVYGEGMWIAADDGIIGRYPTQTPDGPIERFLDGCFICQPTMFFRRELFDRIGWLDVGMRTALDFEYWLRLFKAMPGRIGFIPDILAGSRLHRATKTANERHLVMIEGLRLLRRHLGRTPRHWALTYVEECLAAHRAMDNEAPTAAYLRSLWRELCAICESEELHLLRQTLRADRRLSVASRDIAVDVYADGYSSGRLTVTVRRRRPGEILRLSLLHERPGGGALALSIRCGNMAPIQTLLPAPGPYEVEVDLGDIRPSTTLAHVTLDCDPPFRPSGPGDTRMLGVMVRSARIR